MVLRRAECESWVPPTGVSVGTCLHITLVPGSRASGNAPLPTPILCLPHCYRPSPYLWRVF